MKPNVLSACGVILILGLTLPLLSVPWTASRNTAYILNTEKHFPPAWPPVRDWRAALNVDTYARMTRVLESMILPRGAMIAAKKSLEYHVLRETRLGGVDRGRGGWLFLRETYDRFWESRDRTQNAAALIDAFSARNPAPKARWRLMIAPSKYTLYPERLRPASAALVRRYAWYHDLLAAAMSRPGQAERIELWSAYRQAQAKTPELLFYPKDTHHTPLGAMVMLRALMQSLSPTLWHDDDVRTGDWNEWRGDLIDYSGIWLRPDRARRIWIERPGQRPPSRERSGPAQDWGAPERFRTAPGDRPLWPGRTLIAHDSMLKDYRTDAAQFFSDATFMHYKELIGGGRFARALDTYDTVILEIGERYAVDILERLFQPLAAVSPAAVIAPEAITAPKEQLAIRGRDGALLELETLTPETILHLPPAGLDPRRGHLLGATIRSPQDTWCRLYLHRFDAGGDARLVFEEKVLWRGENQVYYYLAPGDSWIAPELVLYRSGRYGFGPLTFEPLPLATSDAAPVHSWSTTWRTPQGDFTASLDTNAEAQLHPSPGMLWVQSLGNDPQLFLPCPPILSNGRLKLELMLWSSGETLAQIFYQTTPDEGFSETRSLTRRLRTGGNHLVFDLPGAAAGSPLRFDPGCRPGWYGVNLMLYGPDQARLLLPTRVRPLTETWLSGAQGNGQIHIKPIGPDIHCQALGDDPWLSLPPLSEKRDLPFELCFNIQAPIATMGQMFFKTGPWQEFSETNSRQFSLQAGPNLVRISLPPGATRQPLRLDPGCHPGAYVVGHFLITETQAEALGLGQP